MKNSSPYKNIPHFNTHICFEREKKKESPSVEVKGKIVGY